jgi:trans-aconitate 2-methyltransferase
VDGTEQSTPRQAPGTPSGTSAAWDPVRYLRFSGERARPFAELVSRVTAEFPATVVDLGCGEGALTASLAQRWPGARVTGIDSSATMLAAAAAHAVPGQVEFTLGAVEDWQPSGPIDVLVTNATLHWVPGHEQLLARWAGLLAPSGELALQVPGNFRAPTHTLLADLCRSPRWAAQLADAAPRSGSCSPPTPARRAARRSTCRWSPPPGGSSRAERHGTSGDQAGREPMAKIRRKGSRVVPSGRGG